MGVVRDYLGENEDQFLATVFLDSGLLFLATLFVAAASMGTVVFLSVTQAERLIASGMYDLAWNFSRYLMFVYATRMAGVFMISTSSLCIRTRVTPPAGCHQILRYVWRPPSFMRGRKNELAALAAFTLTVDRIEGWNKP
jgi:hypothetical protein